jgi:hypothetical protein
MNNNTETDREGMKLDSEDFFDLMQNYRIAPLGDQSRVIMHFDNVKSWIALYVEQEKRNVHYELVKALETILEMGRVNGNYADTCSAMKTIAKEALTKAELNL